MRQRPATGRSSVGGMDATTRHQRIARRFLVSILQRYGAEAPTVLRQWARDLEALEAETKTAEREPGRQDDQEPAARPRCSAMEPYRHQ